MTSGFVVHPVYASGLGRFDMQSKMAVLGDILENRPQKESLWENSTFKDKSEQTTWKLCRLKLKLNGNGAAVHIQSYR